MIEKRMLVGSSQTEPQIRPLQQVCNTESSRGETPPAPIRKKVCNTEPIRGVLPPEPDRETMRVKDGYFAWEPLDSGDDSDEGEGVVCTLEDDYCSLMAARKEEKETTRRLRKSKQTTGKLSKSVFLRCTQLLHYSVLPRNLVPMPFIILYLKRFASFLAGKNKAVARFLDILFVRAKEKAGPEEFQWLGLMLFVAVPFPGTGAWTGAIIASILDMSFWAAVSANFFGVVLAGLLVNLLVNLGLKYAIITGIILFIISTFMWSILRNLRKSLSSSSRYDIGNS